MAVPSRTRRSITARTLRTAKPGSGPSKAPLRFSLQDPLPRRLLAHSCHAEMLSHCSGAYVETVHRRLGPVLEQELNRVGCGRDGFFHDRVHSREHVVGDADTHTKSFPILPIMERRPLCPPAPPPTFTLTVPASRSRSSWTTTRFSGLYSETAEPELFMKVVGLRSVASVRPRVMGAASALFRLRQEPAWRLASSSATR